MDLRGLYAITDAGLGNSQLLLQQVKSALRGGADMIQYRDKNQDKQKRLQEAKQIKALCDRFNKPLIINDDIDLAVLCQAAGVHLGKDDASIPLARDRLGADKIIGLSCYNIFEAAIEAQTQGANYVAFGSFYPSPSKPNAVKAEISLLKQAKSRLNIPICAIGGITAGNAKPLIDAGADIIAVISDIFHQTNIEQATKNIAALF